MRRERLGIEVTHYTQESRSGAALYVFKLVKAIAHRGVPVNLVCPRDYEHLERLSTIEGVVVRADLPPLVGVFGRYRKLWQMLGQTIVGLNAVRALRPGTIVHVNFPGLIFFAAPLLVGFRLSGLKVVLNVHDVLPHRWLLPKALRGLERMMFRSAYLAANTLVVHHRGALDLLYERFGIPRGKVSIIPHGPFNLADTPPPYEESDEVIVLLFGSLRENKGVHLAVRAVQELRAAELPVRLVVAGRPYVSEEAYWRRCMESIAAAPDGISVVDRYIEEHEVRDVIAGAHLFVLPYTEFHSQSGVAALALSNGRPIVATQAGGLSELVIPGRTGLLVERPTVESVKNTLEQAVRIGHSELARMGWEAYAFFESNYSWDAIADEYIKLYRRLGAGPKRPETKGNFSLYGQMLRRWVTMVSGKSYWHLNQGLGNRFVPGRLAGYYNDLSGKTRWDGPVDDASLPLNRMSEGRLVYFPTTILQKALGHWDEWLRSGRNDVDHHAMFIRMSRWAVDAQDERGGWEIWPLVGLSYASPYSAMTQGEGISVLVRAFSVTGEETYLDGARRALSPLLAEVSEGGTCRTVPEGLILEEVPLDAPATILNGWIFALYGLYDLLLMHDSPDVREAIEASLNALVAYLPQYDAGFWSYYDTKGNLASPFYHHLHIAQLSALELSFPERAASFALLREIFEKQASSRLNRTKAVALKGYQKLRHPPEVVLQ